MELEKIITLRKSVDNDLCTIRDLVSKNNYKDAQLILSKVQAKFQELQSILIPNNPTHKEIMEKRKILIEGFKNIINNSVLNGEDKWYENEAGKEGERYTRLDCSIYLRQDKYRKYHDILIKTQQRDTQIDHIVVSEYGIFVIETKTMNGSIYGNPDNQVWSEVFGKYQKRFQNPLRQNLLHTKLLAEFLKVDHNKIFSVIVFWGDCEFKTDMPANVRRRGFIDYIRNKKEIILTQDEVKRICLLLHTAKKDITSVDRQTHIESLNSTIKCPRCGSKLVERISLKGKRPGSKFLGCIKYPACTYSRDVD